MLHFAQHLLKGWLFLLLLRTFAFCYFTSGNDLSFIVLIFFCKGLNMGFIDNY